MTTTKKQDNLVDLFEQSVEKKVTQISDKGLKSLSQDMNTMLEIGGQIGNAEEALKRLKEQYRQYSEEKIPQRMQEMGISDLRMDDGSRISVDPFYSARITEKNRAEAHDWLRSNGLGDLIKNTVSVNFATGEDEIAQDTMDALEKQGLMPTQKEAVHPSTLKAAVKGLIESGETAFDSGTQKVFSVYTGQRTKIIKG
jgi:hypothetical protein